MKAITVFVFCLIALSQGTTLSVSNSRPRKLQTLDNNSAPAKKIPVNGDTYVGGIYMGNANEVYYVNNVINFNWGTSQSAGLGFNTSLPITKTESLVLQSNGLYHVTVTFRNVAGNDILPFRWGLPTGPLDYVGIDVGTESDGIAYTSSLGFSLVYAYCQIYFGTTLDPAVYNLTAVSNFGLTLNELWGFVSFNNPTGIGISGMTLTWVVNQVLTSSPLSTAPVTSGSVTSGALTSAPATSGDVTTGISLTSGDATTSPATSGDVTTGVSLTSGDVTSSPATSGSVTTGVSLTSGDVTTGISLTTSPATSNVVTTSPLTSVSLTTSPATSDAVTTGLTPEVTTGQQSPVTTGLTPEVTTGQQSPVTTGQSNVAITSGNPNNRLVFRLELEAVCANVNDSEVLRVLSVIEQLADIQVGVLQLVDRACGSVILRFTAPQSDEPAVNDTLQNNAFIAGYRVLSASSAIVVIIGTSGVTPVTSTTSGDAVSDEPSGLTQGALLAAILVPIAIVTFIVILVVLEVVRRRKNKSGDEEKGQVEMKTKKVEKDAESDSKSESESESAESESKSSSGESDSGSGSESSSVSSKSSKSSKSSATSASSKSSRTSKSSK